METENNKDSRNKIPCGVCRVKCDKVFTIVWANDRYYKMFGYTGKEEQKEITGVKQIIYPGDFQRLIRMLHKKIEQKTYSFECEHRYIHKTGKIMWMRVQSSYDPCEGGTLTCAIMDITDQKNEEVLLAFKEEENRIAFAMTGKVMDIYDIKNRTLYIDKKELKNFALPGVIPNMPDGLLDTDVVIEDSKEEVSRFFQSMADGIPMGEIIVRLKNRKGGLNWYRMKYRLTYDTDGEAQRGIIVYEDYTVQREKEAAYEKWQKYNENQLAGEIVSFECNLNQNAVEHIGGPMAGELIQRADSYDELAAFVTGQWIYEDDRQAFEHFFTRTRLVDKYYKKDCSLKMECRVLDSQGDPVWTEISVFLLTDAGQDEVRAMILIRNIDKEKRRSLELENRSQIDPLTGLLNRGTVIEEVSMLLEHSPLSSRHIFIMVDIDFFKSLNDQMGHQFGDRVLREISNILKTSVRINDIVGRLGGDEFVMCLRDIPLNTLLEQKLGSIIAQLSRHYEEDICVSGSMGVAVYPKDGTSFDELYMRADAALYTAKELGRNQFVFYQQGMEQKKRDRNRCKEEAQPAAGMESSGQEYKGADYKITDNEEYRTEFGMPKHLDEKDLINHYLNSLYRIFSDIAVMNVTKNYYRRMLNESEGKEQKWKIGNLTEELDAIARNRICSEDGVRFKQFTNWELVRKAIQEGNSSVYGEFRTGVNVENYKAEDYKWESFSLVRMDNDNGDEVYLCLIQDIHARKVREEENRTLQIQLRRQIEDECYRRIMELSGTILLEYDRENDSYYASPPAKQFTFIKNVGVNGNQRFITQDDVHPNDWQEARGISRKVMGGAMNAGATVRLKKTDGQFMWCHIVLTVLRSEDGSIIRSLFTITDVDEATRNRRELEYRAEYDDLTGCSNFSRFKIEARKILENRNEKKYALWYCDLRNFKLVNNVYGYDFGDQVLQYWAKISSREQREGEIFARVSADHFVSLLWYDSIEELEQRFQKNAGLLAKFKGLAGKKLRLEMVAGIYLVEIHGKRNGIEDMIDCANLAQKSVKVLEGSRYAVYTEDMRRQILSEKEMEAAMYKALENREFCAYFQPIAEIQDGIRVTGAETLARWIRPGYGVVPPNRFIPLFEKNGFIIDLDSYMFEEACRFLRKWLDEGREPIKISVNVSRISVFQRDFSKHYIRLKEKYNIPNGLLELECTESVLVENAELLEMVMRTMRVSGFFFSMDDFGSGYSSLNLLKDITVDILKLDMMFFRNENLKEPRHQTIISSIISMARALNMKVVAEGVETEEQLQLLRKFGCDYIQGYLISRPIPEQEFEDQF